MLYNSLAVITPDVATVSVLAPCTDVGVVLVLTRLELSIPVDTHTASPIAADPVATSACVTSRLL